MKQRDPNYTPKAKHQPKCYKCPKPYVKITDIHGKLHFACEEHS